jgi:Protein of unknown function (DUF3892)
MTTYTVTKVRMESSDQGGRHEHIEGVCTTANLHYTRKEVVDSLDAGDSWKTSADGSSATIKKMTYCKHAGCMATPYITTDADATAKDNLDNLPPC